MQWEHLEGFCPWDWISPEADLATRQISAHVADSWRIHDSGESEEIYRGTGRRAREARHVATGKR